VTPFLLTPEAEAEIRDSYGWYEQRVAGLDSEFLRAVEVAMSSAQRAPMQYRVWRDGARRVLLRRFPFAIYYTVQTEGIIVFACFHGKRNPRVLIKRITSR
jgi:plasmid stabilization system protein ParE